MLSCLPDEGGICREMLQNPGTSRATKKKIFKQIYNTSHMPDQKTTLLQNMQTNNRIFFKKLSLAPSELKSVALFVVLFTIVSFTIIFVIKGELNHRTAGIAQIIWSIVIPVFWVGLLFTKRMNRYCALINLKR